MNFFMKQKAFSWGDNFTIYDENGNDIYHVKGKVLSLGKKLYFYDLYDNELAFIHQKVLSFLPKYYINRDGEDIAEVVKKISFLKPKYVVNMLDWIVEGKFTEHEYTIKEDGIPIVSITKKWFTLGDAYEISISERVDPVNALSVVLIIDACLAAQRNSTYSASTVTLFSDNS